jgi:FkbH-like protein
MSSWVGIRERLAVARPPLPELMACAADIAALAAGAAASGGAVRRVALAADLTPDLLRQGIACAIAQEGELALVHAAPYGAMRQACLDGGSALHAFEPEVVVLVPDWRQALEPLPLDADADAVAADTARQVQGFEAIWAALEARGCRIVQHLFVPPAPLWRGVADRRSSASDTRRVQALNEALIDAGAGRVTWLEADRLAAGVGLAAWSAPRFFHAGKLGFDPRFLPDYLPWFRGAWRATTGRTRKLLVLDLDDTLWGGTIGDDGLGGIALGPAHGGKGEAFAAWQQHLAGLSRRGVVLAVCSKNAPEIAATGFEHADSALRREDFAAFVCSWGDKATGLRRIAQELNLGLDAAVFVDDNPAERALVQQLLPEVAVVDIGADPAQFIERLEAGHWFDQQAYTEVDQGRSAAYAALRQARAEQTSSADIGSYLAGLAMQGHAGPARAQDLPRLAQMELKTNQFNLTTRRYTQAQLAAQMQQPDRLVLAFHLKDRFGDHGLVGSLLAVREAQALRIDSWLLSCRVFSRGAEPFILRTLVLWAREQGASALVGEYLASARNAVVADLYAKLGFAPWSADGRLWRRDLAAPLDDLTSSIAEASP